MKLLEIFNDLQAEQQTRIKRGGIIAAFILVALFIYYGTGKDEKITKKVETEKDLRLSSGLLEDDIGVKVDNKLAEAQQFDAQQDEEIQNIRSDLNRALIQLEKMTDLAEQRTLEPSNLSAPSIDALNDKSIQFPPPPSTTQTDLSTFHVEASMVGGIGHAVGSAKEVVDEKKEITIRLPPGFMEGTLLTGIEADALGNSTGEPEPIMIRIDSPTVLPNRLRADLKGCFVIASAYGKINKERVEARLVSLHCVRKNGFSAVEAELKGYVADQDGKKGMAGIVVSKAGPLVLRSAIGGTIIGAGEAISKGSATTTVTGSGAVSTYDGEQIAKSAFGGGVSRGAEKFDEILVEYIRQTTPIIEVGTKKIVTICITEPIELKIIETDQFGNF